MSPILTGSTMFSLSFFVKHPVEHTLQSQPERFRNWQKCSVRSERAVTLLGRHQDRPETVP